MKVKSNEKFVVALFFLIVYVFYGMFFDQVLAEMSIQANLATTLASDLVFLGIITFYYKNYLIEQAKKYFKKENVRKKIFRAIKWSLVMILISMVMGGFRVYFLGRPDSDMINSGLVNGLNSYYRIFKTLVFAVIAEELLFRKTIRDVIDEDVLFILVASFIYSYMNIVFIGISNIFIIFDFIVYFLFYTILNYLYVKYNNIFVPMTIKFTYALLITILLGVS